MKSATKSRGRNTRKARPARASVDTTGMVRRRVPLDSLVPDPANARLHGRLNLATITASLRRWGQVEPLVVQAGTSRIIGGHGRQEAMQGLGWTEAEIVELQLSDAEARALGLALNRSGEQAEWDDSKLAALLAEVRSAGVPAEAVGYSDAEISRIVTAAASEGPDDVAKVDQAEELQAKWATAPGQAWIVPSKTTLGQNHRILCGDATKPADVSRCLGGAVPFIMTTDPPYGVSYDPSWRVEAGDKGGKAFGASRLGRVENDARVDWTEAWKLFPGDVVYAWHASLHTAEVKAQLETAGFEIRSQICWAKQSHAISRGHYHWRHEPCWYGVRKGRTSRWCGDRSQTTLWTINSVGLSGQVDEAAGDGETAHGTQKPVEAMARPMRNHGAPGDTVYDPFLGSGTSIVAAERTGRLCCGLEISPGYVAVILERLVGMGLEPRLEG